jgi:YegS C-terminal NAD kinase beta sandwich-like domain
MTDAEVAARGSASPGTPVRLYPGGDLARALGATAARVPTTELRIDGLQPDDAPLAVNMIVLGHAPDRLRWRHRRRRVVVEVDGRALFAGRATTVVIASGEYLRGHDVVPRGHPGDGRAEVHVYAVPRRDRAELRRRLPTGTHLPHPGVRTATGRRVVVRWGRPQPLEIDGEAWPAVPGLGVSLVPEAMRVLV